MSLAVRTVAPAALPVSLAEVKQHLRVGHGDEDAMIQIYLDAAVEHLDGVAGWLGRAIMPQTWAQPFDVFAPTLRLDIGPVTGIDSITYRDAVGTTQTVNAADYQVIGMDVVFDTTFSAPVTQGEPGDITVTFTAGFDPVPAPLKVAVMLMVGDMYANRETARAADMKESRTVRMLIDPYRRGWCG